MQFPWCLVNAFSLTVRISRISTTRKGDFEKFDIDIEVFGQKD
jgi:hypothetical protein